MVTRGSEAGPRLAIEIPAAALVPSKTGSKWPTFFGVNLLITDMLEACELKIYRLGRLLGQDNGRYVHTWLNGTHRPSALYLSRLLKLLMMENSTDADGKTVRLKDMKTIDWRTGAITWEVKKHGNDNADLPVPGRYLLERLGKDRGPVPESGLQQQGGGDASLLDGGAAVRDPNTRKSREFPTAPNYAGPRAVN